MPLEQYSSPCVLYSRLRSFSGIAVVCFTEHEGIWPFAFEHFLTHLTDKFALGNMRQMIMLKRYDAPFSPYSLTGYTPRMAIEAMMRATTPSKRRVLDDFVVGFDGAIDAERNASMQFPAMRMLR